MAQELRARLRGRHAILKQMGDMYVPSRCEPVWWSERDLHAGVVCWWMYGAASRAPDADPRRVNFRDGAEALVLLEALVNADYSACVEEVRAVWTRRFVRKGDHAEQRRVVGFEYRVDSCDDLAPISERVLGEQSPSDTFVSDLGWLTSELATAGGDTRGQVFQHKAFPVRLRVSMARENTAELVFLLQQILQTVRAQRLHTQRAVADDTTMAAECTRFEIIEVAMNDPSMAANAESLECIATLMELGIRFRYLPLVCDQDEGMKTRLSVVRSLQQLLPLPGAAVSQHSIETVYFDENTVRLIPALFSALQANKSVKVVEMHATQDPLDWDDDNVPDGMLSLWRWVAYALFSRHALHDVKVVKLRVDFLTHVVLEGVQQVLQAANPLAALFESAVEDDQWIQASCFMLDHPEGDESDERSLFSTPTPLRVRVTQKTQGDSSWQVLVPGCGAAWVKDTDVTHVATDDVQLTAIADQDQSLRWIKLSGMIPSKKRAVMNLLRLIAYQVETIEVDTDDDFEGTFGMTEWTLELLRSCPTLDRLMLPRTVEIRRLCALANAAEAGHFPLRSLSLRYTFNSASSDIIEFLHVLCDASHPLTKQLEEFDFDVLDVREPTRDFEAAWKRLLQQNRRLHTISLFFQSPEYLKKSGEEVAIRTGPVPIASKLAFLSAVQDTKRDMDTSVIGIIFGFAAQHRVRSVDIMQF